MTPTTNCSHCGESINPEGYRVEQAVPIDLDPPMTTYERVSFQDPRGRSLTVLLRDVLEMEADGVQVLEGQEVNRAGEAVSGAGFDQRQRIIGRTLITKRTPMTMNLTYGVLEPVAG